jgi:hypothetical protein
VQSLRENPDDTQSTDNSDLKTHSTGGQERSSTPIQRASDTGEVVKTDPKGAIPHRGELESSSLEMGRLQSVYQRAERAHHPSDLSVNQRNHASSDLERGVGTPESGDFSLTELKSGLPSRDNDAFVRNKTDKSEGKARPRLAADIVPDRSSPMATLGAVVRWLTYLERRKRATSECCETITTISI